MTLLQKLQQLIMSCFTTPHERDEQHLEKTHAIESTTISTSSSILFSKTRSTKTIAIPTVIETSTPSTQQALTLAAKHTYRLDDDFPVPEIAASDEILIRNCAVGLNPIGWKSMDYNFCSPAYPWITGRELSGMVEQVGEDVTTFTKGDRVWTSTYYRDIRSGCFQEYVIAPQHTVQSIPSKLSFEAASCLGVCGLTAAMTL